MRALASEYVFTQRDAGAKVAKDIKSDREAVDFAIGFEKDSIVFYQGMKRIVPEHDLKPLDALIAQEEGHLQNLLELKKEILKRKGGSGG